MEKCFENYLSSPNWLIIENKWEPNKQYTNEANFTLGNGYVCSRGILEEMPDGSQPGTFFTGLYDSTGAQVTELINAPNPINISISVGGEHLGARSMDILEHERILDMQTGVLVRRNLYSNSRKEKFDYKSARFFSMNNKHTAVMKIYLTPLDADETITIDSFVDTSTMNKGYVTEGHKKHFHVTDFSKQGSINYVCAKTLEKEILIAFASELTIQKGKKIFSPKRRTVSNLDVKKGETICITKYFSFYTSRDINAKKIMKRTIETLETAVSKGFDCLFLENKKVWKKKWNVSDIEICGNNEDAKAVRFNIYHLLIASSEKNLDVSIGAKTLSGEGYRGHVFWDTEIFMLPFFIYTNSRIAKNFLLYRYNRLHQAREKARENNYRGAMFVWESADLGDECTPLWYKDKHGDIQKVTTGLFEHHITADIAYATSLYYEVTGDEIFMINYGMELIFETARFWQSRVDYNKKNKRYEISAVTGPDEFHEHINNNAFTNIVAAWNLEYAYNLYSDFSKKHPLAFKKIVKKIGLTPDEIEDWKKISQNLYVPVLRTGIVEQFAGFLKLKKNPITHRNKYLLLKNHNELKEDEIKDFQFVKQADVLMIFLLFPHYYDSKIKIKNYEFYEPKTLHFSSLSPSAHAIVGLDVGALELAYKYFVTSAYLDIRNIYHHTGDGMHAASLGGVWQIVIYGFAGIRILENKLFCDPKLPKSWKSIKCCIIWKGHKIKFFIDKNTVTISTFNLYKKYDFKINVYGKDYIIDRNKLVILTNKIKTSAK
ncbi:glycoside hydrolase family 65 protein [bacterium]